MRGISDNNYVVILKGDIRICRTRTTRIRIIKIKISRAIRIRTIKIKISRTIRTRITRVKITRVRTSRTIRTKTDEFVVTIINLKDPKGSFSYCKKD